MNTDCKESYNQFKQSYNDFINWIQSVNSWKDEGYSTNVPRLLMVRVVDIANSMVIQYEQCSEGCIPSSFRELIEVIVSLRYLHEDPNLNVNSYLVNGIQQHISLLDTLKNNKNSRSKGDIDSIDQAKVKYKEQIKDFGNVKSWPQVKTLCQKFYDHLELNALYSEMSGYSHSKLVQNVSHIIQSKNGNGMVALELLPIETGNKIWRTAGQLIDDTRIKSAVLAKAYNL